MTIHDNDKNRRLLTCIAAGLMIIALTSSSFGQGYTPGYPPAPPVAANPGTAQPIVYSPDQLDQMLGPIALYPDPLLSEVLAASTYPQDVAAAGQWLQNNPTPTDDDINNQPWDASVKAIVHSPEAVEMMAGNMDWTEAIGAAFANQQQDVMDSVQRLRAKAQAAQTLTSTPEQQVVQDDGDIEILPAQPDVIYVPEYDPDIVYTTPLVAGPFITFGLPCPYGIFFDLDFDFRNHRFLRGVQFDRDTRRFDFAHAQGWQHDPHRPIPVSPRAFTAPRGVANNRGWGEAGRSPSAFNPAARSRAPAASPRAPQRPVKGVPAEPARSTPPRAPAAPAQPRPVPVPARPAAPQPAPQRQERPVSGLPARAAPAEHPAPAPAPRPAPAREPEPAPAPRPAPAPAPAFHPDSGGGGASARGHDSMHR